MGVDRRPELVLGDGSAGGGPPLRGPLASLGMMVYGWGVSRRNRRFDAGRGVVRFDRPVISVGNLSVGGTGKTPVVSWVLARLVSAGRRPCVAMRGYRARGGESDEEAAYRRRWPAIPIVAQANRTLGLIRLFAEEYDAGGPGTDCVVLDDGFQHRQIGRELDIVLIDATRDPFADRLLPGGWLREPVESLARADVVVLTHADRAGLAAVERLDRRVRDVRGTGVDAVTRHSWEGIEVIERGACSERPVAWLAGRRALAVCAIGNPGPFLAGVAEACGRAPAGTIALRDHDSYGASACARILREIASSGAEVVVTTEKDWVKLGRRGVAWPCAVAVPRLGIVFDRGGEALASRVVEVATSGVAEDQGPEGEAGVH